jgi:predicted AAA+ superfamily ATPase
MRYLTKSIEKDLVSKMVFLSGPRQCGKTTLAKAILNHRTKSLYLNWDSHDDRRRILSRDWSEDSKLIVFDEIHKYPRWKNWLKGLYDTTEGRHQFLVTGSARLDVYRRGGDSMFGRYHPWRLHPFCLAELPKGFSPKTAFFRLLERGGFPEPFLARDVVNAKRWRRERRELLLREDLRDLERVREITLISLLMEQLTDRVGSLVVVSNMARDLEVAPKTVKHWIDLLERMFLLFVVMPYSQSLPRALRKPFKVYFYDNAEAEGSNEGPRFENLVASHLFKRIQFLEDSTGDEYQLRFLRDKEGHEVDFLILKNRKPSALIEAKWSELKPSASLRYFGEKLKVKTRIQLVAKLSQKEVRQGVEIWPAVEWLSQDLNRPLF